jgi:hypothetical protein
MSTVTRNPFATHLDAWNTPMAFSPSEWPYYPTPCCGAAVTIDTDSGVTYCRACYEDQNPMLGGHPVEPYASALGITRKNEILWKGRIIGTVARVEHNTYSASDMDGNVVVERCYANGGAKHSAAFTFVTRLGLVADGERVVHIDAKGQRIHGGPWTVSLSSPKGAR